MSIHQTPDGRWYASYYPPGSRRAKKRYFGKGAQARADADAWDADYRRRKLAGLPTEERPAAKSGPGPTFNEIALAYIQQRPLTPHHRQSLASMLAKWVVDSLGTKPVSELSMRDLAALDVRFAAAGLAIATRNRNRSYCKTILNWGVTNEFIDINPFARYRPDKKKEARAPGLMTDNELQRIIACAPKHLAWAIICMINIGVRPGKTELFRIRIVDVDFERGGIWIDRPKTNSPHAMIPITPSFQAAIAALLPDRIFLIEYKGHPVGSLKTVWLSTLRRAGIERRLRLYDLRHFFASRLLAGGGDIKAVSELLGHTSPTLTLATYYHLVDTQKREAVEKLTLPDFGEYMGSTWGVHAP